MDEILIEEKKYVSSKQAAKVTGYAKDYIGQLCREGRVPARLVGRSWYVLESAIQDHRFGDQKTEQEEKSSAPELQEMSVFAPTWESPRYEASPAEALPPVNRTPGEERVQNLQDSWKAWFDRVADAAPSIPDVVPEKRKEPEEETADEESEGEKEEESVPIRAIYRQPPEELLPRRGSTREVQEDEEFSVQEERRGSRRGLLITTQLVGALLALVVAGLAIFGSGYFDTYALSHTRVGSVAGVILYSR